MNKIVAIASSTALVLITSLASIAPADAQRGPGPGPGPSFSQRQQFVADWCRRNPRDPDCRDFNRGRWGDAQYSAWFNRHRHDRGFSAPAGIAAMFGALAGAAIAGAANNNNNMRSNSAACAARYRSYDPRTGTFLGTDGRRHPCTL